MDPWGTPADILATVEDCPLMTTFCLRSVKYDFSQLSIDPQIPFCLNLKTRPSCQTLSNALVASRDT